MNQKLITTILKKIGLDVDVAVNGIEAIIKNNKQNYDLILMDLQMPKMGGLQATSEIRQDGDETPIIALTANAIGNIYEDCMKLGMNGF
jgi:two-component system, sensor histidine kinase